MSNTNPTKVIVPCRLSYAHLWEPDSINGSEPKYSVSCIIDKDNTEIIAKIIKAIEVAKEEGNGR
uniref:ssDNA-binding protein n=1 Tax=Agathobacter sp. TaxID=2021311 RepID=UPI004027F3D6